MQMDHANLAQAEALRKLEQLSIINSGSSFMSLSPAAPQAPSLDYYLFREQSPALPSPPNGQHIPSPFHSVTPTSAPDLFLSNALHALRYGPSAASTAQTRHSTGMLDLHAAAFYAAQSQHSALASRTAQAALDQALLLQSLYTQAGLLPPSPGPPAPTSAPPAFHRAHAAAPQPFLGLSPLTANAQAQAVPLPFPAKTVRKGTRAFVPKQAPRPAPTPAPPGASNASPTPPQPSSPRPVRTTRTDE